MKRERGMGREGDRDRRGREGGEVEQIVFTYTQ